ncbi:hypothetical protein FRC00_003975 [Tulasnella sp. 408]|nr:hypothetical protein FRC00_003975 [Tulasnella sp. 408]
MGDHVPDFTANEMGGMIGLTATRGAVDVVAAVRSTVSQQEVDTRSGSAVIAAAPQLQTSFGLLATPEVHLDRQERRLGERHIAEATRPVWGFDSPHSSSNDITLMPVVPSSSALEPPTTQDHDMHVDESVTVHDGEGGNVGEGVDDAPQEEDTSSLTSSTSSSSGSNALDNMSSDEEMMEMLEANLATERAALSAADTLQSAIHDGLVAQQNELDVEGMSIGSLVEEVAMRESWGRGEEGVEEVGSTGLRTVKSDLKLASHVASSSQ